MSKDLNQYTFTGRLGKDVESRFTQSGDAVANFSVAVGDSWKSASGEKKETTTWVRVVAFKKLAEIMAQYLKKGSKVLISGRMDERKYTDKEGNERSSWEVTAEKMIMLDTKRDSEESQDAEQSEPRSSNARTSAKTEPTTRTDSSDGDGFDSDVPF